MDEEVTLSEADRALLQAVYDLMRQRGSWPTFTAVDLHADRKLGVEDSQAAFAAIPSQLIFRPWHSHGYYDTDEVRLQLRGVNLCEGGPADLALLVRLVAWVVELEQNDEGGPEEQLVATAQAFADYVGLQLEPPEIVEQEQDEDASADQGDETVAESPAEALAPAPPVVIPPEIIDARALMVRVRVLAELLPSYWSGAGWQTDKPWQWQYTVDRQRLRPYRHLQGLEALIAYTEKVDQERRAAANALTHRALSQANAPVTPSFVPGEDDSGDRVVPASGVSRDLDILLTLLREEIADSAADLVRANQLDEAIFAAVRRVEHELQQRTGSTLIGDPLIDHAFRDSASPIRISDRDQDSDRMREMFRGAIGLLKGDRSHKDRPSLPCRSRRECLRVLAHASSLLDLLDRDVAKAPRVRGYEHHQGGTLTLWVERAGSQVDIWLDEVVPLEKISFRTGTLVVNVAGIAAGEHRIHLAEGTRQGSAHTVWIARDPGRESWHRVLEVNVPLYADVTAKQQLDVDGLRLLALESGVISERIVPTRQTYQVGHYVEWNWSNDSISGAAWARDRASGPLRPLWDSGSALFDGQPVAPAHAERLMRISFEPNHLRVRGGEKVPLRVLGHYTDGVATWTEQVDDPEVTTENEAVGFFKGGALIAKDPGTVTLRCLHSGHYAEAVVEVAAHPRGTVTEYLSGLPPVSGIAWTTEGLVVSNRDTKLWRVGKNGVFRTVAAVPPSHAAAQGTDNIFARKDGELALRLIGVRDLLVLHHDDDYRSSHWVELHGDGNPMAAAWVDDALLVATHTGALYRIGPNNAAELITSLDAHPVEMVHAGNAVLVLCGPGTRILDAAALSAAGERPPHHRDASLWRVPLDAPDQAENLLADKHLANLSGLAWTGTSVLLSEFHGGRVWSLSDGQLKMIASDLSNPAQLTISDKGEVYIAEVGGGRVRRIFA